jgi:hypothetical protein
MQTPVDDNGFAGGFTAVSCPRATACTAIGHVQNQQWDGSAWTGDTGPGGSGISCTAPTGCTVVRTSPFYYFTAPAVTTYYGEAMNLPFATRRSA